MAIPAALDTPIPKPVCAAPVRLHKASACAVGGNHPAIFSLLAPETAAADASLAKDENDRWVLNVPAKGVKDGKKMPLTVRLVVVGKVAG